MGKLASSARHSLLSDLTWVVPKQQPKGVIAKFVYYLKSHPLLFLILLTPGIPEYLSASSQLTALVINPFGFLFQLGSNIGLYGSGVILIREAMIRWKKGWASVFLLGAAYGIFEEGLTLWTLFYSNADPVGTLGYYGHWLGVNWVWTIGLVIFHSVYSIGLPIFLFGLAFPELKSKSLVSGLGVKATLVTLIIDSIALFILVSNLYSPYSPGAGLLLSGGLAITVLVMLARKLPGNFLTTGIGQPKWGPRRFAFVGALLFPATLFAGGISAGAGIPPIVPFVLDLLLAIFILTRAYKSMGTANNQEQKVALGIGLIFPLADFGLVASIGLGNPLIIVADMLFIMFSRRLWRKWHKWTLIHRSGMQTTLPSFGGPSTPSLP